MKILCAALLLLLQFSPYRSFSQHLNLQFDHLGASDGLSQSNVLCMLQDSRGFMWFGTTDGLNRYDGYKFYVYKNQADNTQSVAGNHITGIEENADGDIWVATLGSGLCRYDRKKDRFIRYRADLKKPDSLSNDYITSLQLDNHGNLWIGTEYGLDMFDPAKNKFVHFTSKRGDTTSLSGAFIRYIFEDSDNNIWICTLNDGINLYNPNTGKFTQFKHDKNDYKSISSNSINIIFEDIGHRLWIGTNGGGMDLFDRKTGTFSHFTYDDSDPESLGSDVVYAINEDADQNLWIGTENDGLSVYNRKTGTFVTYKNDAINSRSISNNSINSIYKDAKNNMWLCNFDGGIDMVSRDKVNFSHFNHMVSDNSLSNKHVLSIYEDTKNKIWIGTDGGGLDLFDPQSGSFRHFRHNPNNSASICGNNVLTTLEDVYGNIWIGTWGQGITIYNPSKNTYRHLRNEPGNPSSLNSNNVWNIYQDKEQNIWICTLGGGLDLLNADRNSFTHFTVDPGNSKSISNNDVVAILEDSDGQLWVCTDGGGLNLFDKKNKSFLPYLQNNSQNSISNNDLTSIYEDGNRNLWISTRNGLNKFNKKTGKFKIYTTADGLPGNIIYGVLEDQKKNLWISTNKGISCFTPGTGIFKNYTIADGLQSNEFKEKSFCLSRSGMMYFGGNNGFNQFSPASVKPVAFDPPLVITSFMVFNKEVSIGLKEKSPSVLQQSITETRSITLPYSSSMFSFEFASLNYTSAEKKRYAYMLEGFDLTWNDAGAARTATYTNLDPGNYVFKVKGLKNDGTWSANILQLEIIIKPPFWLTWWFRLLLVVFVGGVIVGIYKYRVHTIKVQKRYLEKKVMEQTRQLVIAAQDQLHAREAAEKAMHETELLNNVLRMKNKELEQFAYVASHDLQEPLRTTSSFVALIQKQYIGRLDGTADKYLNYIADASARMKVLIKDLLDYSRIGSKGEPQIISSNGILKNVLHDLTAAVQEAGADIRHTDLPEIDGYPTEIKLLFQNLLINAIKFRKKDIAPQIKINAVKQDSAWQFSFKDNGIGIAQEHNERIFSIFQRLHTRTEYEGSGIGLSHCKKIVELHHGKIWVDSAPGEGSTFYFTIPVKYAAKEMLV